jgi:hypothetical protein
MSTFPAKIKGVPGYVFNLGSQGLQDKLAAEEDSFDEIVGKLIGIEPKIIHPLYTWTTQDIEMLDHLMKESDDTT